jgi:predicted esterase
MTSLARRLRLAHRPAASRGAAGATAATAAAALIALLAAGPAHAFWDLPRLWLSDGSYALYVAPPAVAAGATSRSGADAADDSTVPGPPVTARAYPVVLALHGMADRPDWACHIWSTTAGPEFGFFVCPHGKLRAAPTIYRGVARPGFPTASAWSGAGQAKARGLEALGLLRGRFGATVAPNAAVCVGFSQGAYLSIHLALHDPTVCRAAIAAMPFFKAEWVPRPPPGVRPPPIYLVTGTRDVGYRHVLAARDRLAAFGYPVEVKVFAGLGHDWAPDFSAAVHPAFDWVAAKLAP